MQRQVPILTFLLLVLVVVPRISLSAPREQFSLKQPGWISSLAFSADGQLLVNACSDNAAHLRKTSTGEEIATFTGHADYVSAVALSPDTKTLATASYDHTARLWDIASKKSRVLNGHRGAVMAVAFSPDGTLLATGSLDSTIILWRVKTTRPYATLRGHKSWVNSLAFTSDGATLVSGSSDGTVKSWNVKKHKLDQSLEVTNTEVRAIAVSADGQTIAAGQRYGAIKLFFNRKEAFSFKAHDGDVWSLAFTPGAKTLISGGGDWNKPGQVKLWNARTAQLLSSLPSTGEVLSVTCSPAGNWIASGTRDKTLTVWRDENSRR
jgi:WD40 repeat protein